MESTTPQKPKLAAIRIDVLVAAIEHFTNTPHILKEIEPILAGLRQAQPLDETAEQPITLSQVQ